MSEATAVRLPRRFATWISALFALIVFAGFARTYYLKAVFDGPVLTSLRHVHLQRTRYVSSWPEPASG
jgi:hypothetical protein